MSLSCECFVFCQVDVSATDRSFVQVSPTECVCVCVCVFVCDRVQQSPYTPMMSWYRVPV